MLIIFFSGFIRCQKYDDLSDQNPKLIVNVQLDPSIVPDEEHKLYLMYYNDSTWTESWLTQSTTGKQFFNPVVLSYSTLYLAVFYDADGSTTLSTGDPCIGYNAIDPNSGDPLTAVQFLPLEIKQLDIALNPAPTFP